jgi:hypothetical protein
MSSKWKQQAISTLINLSTEIEKTYKLFSAEIDEDSGDPEADIQACSHLMVVLWKLAKSSGNNAQADCESALRRLANDNQPLYPYVEDDHTFHDNPIFKTNWIVVGGNFTEGEILTMIRKSLWVADELFNQLRLKNNAHHSLNFQNTVQIHSNGVEEEYYVSAAPSRRDYQKQIDKKEFGFHRTALKYSRIIPTVIGNNQIVTFKTIGGSECTTTRPDHDFKILCVVFKVENLKAKYFDETGQPIPKDENNNSTFIVEHIDLTDPHDTIKRAFDLATKEDCQIIIFPELTIYPELLLEVKKQLGNLRANVLQNYLEENATPIIVVAGSWHDQIDFSEPPARAAYVNRSHILDSSDSTTSIEYDKRTIFNFEGHNESIQPSDEMIVLSSPYGLLSVGICKDFLLSVSSANQYSEIDADYILVPSMGKETTKTSHISTLKSLSDNQKSLGIVVQQDPISKNIRGCVLALQKKADKKSTTNKPPTLEETWARDVDRSDPYFYIWDSANAQITDHK